MSSPALRRVERRETHSPRTAAMFVAVILTIALLVSVIVVCALLAAGNQVAAQEIDRALAWLVDAPRTSPAVVLVAAGVCAILGIVFVLLAILPGRLAKHQLLIEDRFVLVDNGVLAAAIAQQVSEATGQPRERVIVGVGHRRVDVAVHSSPFAWVDAIELHSVVDAALSRYQLVPAVRTRVRVHAPKERDLDR